MSEELLVACPRCDLSFDVELPGIPWKNPKEVSPGFGKDCIFKYSYVDGEVFTDLGWITVDRPDEFRTRADEDDFVYLDRVICWCYSEELSLPSWGKK